MCILDRIDAERNRLLNEGRKPLYIYLSPDVYEELINEMTERISFNFREASAETGKTLKFQFVDLPILSLAVIPAGSLLITYAEGYVFPIVGAFFAFYNKETGEIGTKYPLQGASIGYMKGNDQ